MTARRLDQKRPSTKECVQAHWPSAPAPRNVTGLSPAPKPRDELSTFCHQFLACGRVVSPNETAVARRMKLKAGNG